MINSDTALLLVTRGAAAFVPRTFCAFCAACGGSAGKASSPCFPDEDTKVQRVPVTWLRPHGSREIEAGFEPCTHLSDNGNNCHNVLCQAQALRTQCLLLLSF